ncbi:MAG: hypothetical protein H6Q14_1318 [Bacteroidetes bacterium]|nr:hypothetical protein [Bacteroidota bacterium]
MKKIRLIFQYGGNLKSLSAVTTAGSYFWIQNSAVVDLETFITPRTDTISISLLHT